MDFAQLKWDASGFVTVVAQDYRSGEVRMLAHANEEALRLTLERGEAYFYSRSRGALWKKGESSGHTLKVVEVWADCDGDAVLYLVEPNGPTCHTGERNCFFRRLDRVDSPGPSTGGRDEPAGPVFVRLMSTLNARAQASGKASYTRSLLDGGVSRINEKIREEAAEYCEALAGETNTRVVSEAADLMYHALVGLLARGATLDDVATELARRFGTSGHREKASRTPKAP